MRIESDDKFIEPDDFARRFAMRASNLMWLLGSGASAAAGIPTALDMVWEFKQQLYISQRRVSLKSVSDLSNPIVRSQLQAFIDSIGSFPASGSPEEYAVLFEAVWPNEGDRRTYIQGKLAGAKPSYGHFALASLMRANLAKLVWTTNFDPLVADACAKVWRMTSEIAPHIWLPEPKLSFHPERTTDVDIHPLRGLLRFGPHSAGLVPDPIRVATIAPAGDTEKLYAFMRELNSAYEPTERKDYLPKWPGFRAVFGLGMRGAGRECHVELDPRLDREFEQSQKPYVVLADGLVRAIQSLESRRSEFDVLFIYIPARWARGYVGGSDDDFDLHDHLKAATAARRLPIQLVREDKAVAYQHRASVMWRIGLALYAKAGGIPWKLAEVDSEVAYIGISYAVRPPESHRPRFVTCCSQVFDAEGAGLEFVAYDAHEVEVQRDNPFLSRTEMFRVMTRSLDLYRRRHTGRSPRRVIVHKSTEFKKDEINGCMEALHLCEAVDLVQVIDKTGWRGTRIERNRTGGNEPTGFPVERGTVLSLGVRECLLWMHGDVRGISNRGSYFQGARSTPHPVRLVRHAGHGPWDDSARAALALSKMNWNNDALYDPLPVTMGYAQVLARVVKRMSGLGSTPYQFRFFM